MTRDPMTLHYQSTGYWDGEDLADYGEALRQPPTALRPPLPLEALPDPLPDFDLQAYLDQRRDEYLAGEETRLRDIASTVGRMRVEHFHTLLRAAYVAGASAMADGVTARDSLAILHDDEKLARAERRCAMRRELRRQQRLAEVETRISRIASLIG